MTKNIKNVISKLLVLAMIVAMLPVFALTANAVDDNIYGNDKDTKPEVTVEVPTIEVTPDADGTAKAEVSDEVMDKAVTDAVLAAATAEEDIAPVVTIPVKTSADAKKLEVELPADSLKDLVEKVKDASLAIDSDKATVKIDNTALSSLVDQAGSGTISLEVAQVEEIEAPEAKKTLDNLQSKLAVKAQTAAYDLSMMSGTTPIHNFGTGKLDVTLNYTLPENGNANNLRAYYLNDRGLIERFAVKYDNGKVTFTTNHLSTYVISDSALYTEKAFDDVLADSWALQYVNWAVDNGVTTGNSTTANTFGPTETCTRAQFVTFLYRAAGSPAVTDVTNPFTDVSVSLVGEEFCQAILWAYNKGITTGTSATTFAPNDPVLRGQAVTFMSRYATGEKIATKTGTASFSDVANAGAVATYYDAIVWAAVNGISVGNGDGSFSPMEGCQRAQMVTFLYRLFMLAE